MSEGDKTIRERIERRSIGDPRNQARRLYGEWCKGNLIPRDVSAARVVAARREGMERAAEIATTGREVQQPDGSTEMVDFESGSEAAAAICAEAAGPAEGAA